MVVTIYSFIHSGNISMWLILDGHCLFLDSATQIFTNILKSFSAEVQDFSFIAFPQGMLHKSKYGHPLKSL